MGSKKIKKNNLLIRLGLSILAVYVIVSLISLQIEIAGKQQQLEDLQMQIQQQQTVNKELERQLSFGKDQAYLSRIARDKLDMGFSDERVFRDAAGS